MSMSDTVLEALLPASSVAVPVTDWSAPSWSTLAAVQVATPDSPSRQVKPTVTGSLYQPAVFFVPTLVRLELMVGAVPSRLIVTDCSTAEPPALVAEHV